MDRDFLLPLVGIAPMVAGLSGCGPDPAGLIGSWSLEAASGVDGTYFGFPDVRTVVEDGVTYTYTRGFQLTVRDNGSATFGSYYRLQDSTGSDEVSEYFYAGDWRSRGRSFLLEITTTTLDCTPGGEPDVPDALECEWNGAELQQAYDAIFRPAQP